MPLFNVLTVCVYIYSFLIWPEAPKVFYIVLAEIISKKHILLLKRGKKKEYY